MFSIISWMPLFLNKRLIQKRIWHNLSWGFAVFVSSIGVLSKKYKQLKFLLLHHNFSFSFIYIIELCPLSPATEVVHLWF